MRLSTVIICLILSSPLPLARALGPHEIVVLVNERSARSKEVANHFVHLRDVPPQNVVYLPLPDRVLAPAAQITPDEFTSLIWEPARRILEERGLDHVLAWVYSVDFPTRVMTTPPMSILGVTFVRNEIPEEEEIRIGRYRSLLFAGPDTEGGPMAAGGSLHLYRNELQNRMPLPAMMLGFMGARGTDLDAVLQGLQRGAYSDGSAPPGTIYFVRGEDIRAQMRQWQFEETRRELEQIGMRAIITDAVPRNQTEILGLMMGATTVDTSTVGSYRPGSMAEHITSHAGEFHHHLHTKLTDWLRRGATASAGTVTEPLSIWTKFPHARFFAHYARGNTMLESFYQAIRSPTQILLVGEPLARPWRPPLSLTLIALDDDPVTGTADFAVGMLPELPNVPKQFEYHLNGRPIHRTGDILHTLDTGALPDGSHTMRAVVYVGGPVRHQAHGIQEFSVRNHQRAVRLTGIQNRAEVDYYRPIVLNVEIDGADATETVILHNERKVQRVPDDDVRGVEIDPARLGPGPVVLQAETRFADGMAVRSSPLALNVKRLNQPPVIAEPKRERPGPGETIWTPMADDPENDPVHFRWYAEFPLLGDLETGTPDGRIARRDDGYLLSSEDGSDFVTAVSPRPASDLAAIRARMTVQDDRERHPRDELAGIIFNYRNDNDFFYFGLWGRQSAWMLARWKDGQWNRLVTRGSFIQTKKPYDLALLIDEAGNVQGWVNDQVVLEREGVKPEPEGRIGLLSGAKPARFEKTLYSKRGGLTESILVDQDGNVRILDDDRLEVDALTLEAHDGFHSSFRRIPIRESH